jgi:transposase
MSVYIGIDISAKSFDLVVRNQDKSNKSKVFSQTPDGYRKCLKLLEKLKPKLIVMEATGVYYLDLASVLYDAGLPVSVINPASFKRFAELMLTQSKTDSIDATLLAEFAQRIQPRLWIAPSHQCLALKDLGRQVQRLTTDKAKAKNRLHAFQSKQATINILIQDVVESIEHYERRIALLTNAALEIIQNDEMLSHQFKCMTSAKGIGQTSAIAILAEFSILPKEMKAKQVSRYAGLDVKLSQSGTSVNGTSRISKAGNVHLRSALFMPAMSAVRHDENAKAFRGVLVGKGKKKIQANVAVMRKYLTGLWSVYLSGETFDSSKLFSAEHKKACS